jgi:hypothetical protein
MAWDFMGGNGFLWEQALQVVPVVAQKPHLGDTKSGKLA